MSSGFRLRPYQEAAVTAVTTKFSQPGIRKLLLYLPTGSGKTVIAAAVLRRMFRRRDAGRVLFIAHRREIIEQTARTVQRQLPGRSIAIEQGSRSAADDADVTIASVQSLVRRKQRYDPAAFSLLICDECHHALAPSWKQTIEYFADRSDTRLLGMTATPKRTDGRSVLSLFGEVAYEITRAELEHLGYLVPMRYFMVRSQLELERVAMAGSDFQVGALSKVMDTPQLRALTVQAWLAHAEGRKTIVFCSGVGHAHHLAADFQATGYAAAVIDGKTRERDALLRRFERGELPILTNYGVLTEGFDDPAVECIVMARPTTSPVVYTQCIGRGLRPAPRKDRCTVIDIVDRSTHQLQYGATEMAGLPRAWKGRGGNPFRQAQSLAGIKVKGADAFLAIKNATSLEQVQSLLMAMPPELVLAGLDGEPVLRYSVPKTRLPPSAAAREAQVLLHQAGAEGAKVEVDEARAVVKFRAPELDNEQFAHLEWHLARVTGREIEFVAPKRSRKMSSPRALFRSMLPSGCELRSFGLRKGRSDEFMACVEGISEQQIAEIVDAFENASGWALTLQVQMSLF